MDRPIPRQRQGGRQATARAGRGKSRPQRWHPLPNCKQAPVANQVILGSWMVDIRQEGCSQISSPEETHSTPEKVLPLCTQETKWLGWGR